MRKIYIVVVYLILVSFNAYSQLPMEGLIGHWPFNGDASDNIGNNSGDVNGATLCADRFGYPDRAYFFDGKDDNISLSFENAIDINTKSSILLWFKAEKTLNSYAKLICVPYSLETWNSPYHYLAFSGPAFNYANFDTTNGMCETGCFTEVVDTTWNLLAFTYDEGNIKIYINGILKETLSCTNTLLPDGGTMSIGSRSTSESNNGEYFTGIIDDISFYNRVLTEYEIVDYYNYICDAKSRDVVYYYWVSDSNFKEINHRRYLDSTIIELTSNGCDSMIYHYSEFIFKENLCADNLTITDSITIADTLVIMDTISVTDTLFINVSISDLENNKTVQKIKVYPNPANEILYIRFDDSFEQITDYSITITNSTGRLVFESELNESLFEIDVNDFGETGLFLIQIVDNAGEIVDVKKLLLN